MTSICCSRVSRTKFTAYPDTRIVSDGYFSGWSIASSRVSRLSTLMFMWNPVTPKNASSIAVRLVTRSPSTRPSQVGTSVVVSEMPSAASRKGVLASDAAEAWMAAEFEGKERAAAEISQLIFFTQVLIIAADVSLEDVYRHL